MEVIRFENVSKSYDKDNIVIDELNLSIIEGEIISFIGSSGCGKTTLLKLINGLIVPDEGRIYVKNKEIKEWNQIELKRNIGYVIQSIGLFPHMRIIDNIGYVMKIKKESSSTIIKRAKELIALVGLNEEYLYRYPRELSGGEKQRIGLARALSANPDIILMDEPLGALDNINRRILQDELCRIFSDLNKTIIFVTHDIEEALKLGSRIALMNSGKIEQIGTAKEMLLSPKTEFVREFFGHNNFMSYLSATSLESIFTHKTQINYKDNIPTISYKKSLIDAVKLMFVNKTDTVYVENDKREILGEFSIRNGLINENI